MGADDETGTEMKPLAGGGKRVDSDNWPDEEHRENLTVGEHVKEYCSCTSIHGVQYLVGRPMSERIFWIIVFIISFVGNSYLVSKVWLKWRNSPVIVTFAERASPIWEIPFPAVTICPMTRYRATEFDLKTSLEELKNPEFEEDAQWIRDLSLICEFSDEVSTENTTTEDIYENFRKIGVGQFILGYKWRNEDLVDSEWNFTETVTSDGICYTFNGLNKSAIFRQDSIVESYNRNESSEGWTPDGGYLHFDDEGFPKSYPYHAENSGITEGLTIFFWDVIDDFDYWCSGFFPGYKIHLHSPASVPNVQKKYFILEPGYSGLVGIIPDIMRTNENLLAYSPEVRQCYFSNERPLQYFKIYTQPNCELECRTNYTLKSCGCAAFYMPRSNSSIPICGAGMKNCIEDLKVKMQRQERQLGNKGCNCLPSCTNIMFNLEVTQNKFNWAKSSIMETDYKASEISIGRTYSTVSIYFGDTEFITNERSELYGFTDFLANCGGLIGLFSGFSVLSIVEIAYFMSLRGYNNLFWRS